MIVSGLISVLNLRICFWFVHTPSLCVCMHVLTCVCLCVYQMHSPSWLQTEIHITHRLTCIKCLLWQQSLIVAVNYMMEVPSCVICSAERTQIQSDRLNFHCVWRTYVNVSSAFVPGSALLLMAHEVTCMCLVYVWFVYLVYVSCVCVLCIVSMHTCTWCSCMHKICIRTCFCSIHAFLCSVPWSAYCLPA